MGKQEERISLPINDICMCILIAIVVFRTLASQTAPSFPFLLVICGESLKPG